MATVMDSDADSSQENAGTIPAVLTTTKALTSRMSDGVIVGGSGHLFSCSALLVRSAA